MYLIKSIIIINIITLKLFSLVTFTNSYILTKPQISDI